MASLTIFYGASKPIKAVGANQVKLLGFAYKYNGWHTFKTNERATVLAINKLKDKGYLEVIGDQFRFTYPK